MRIVLVRHTRVDLPRGVCYGWTDVPLAPTFVQEAAATKAALSVYEPFDKAFTSPLTRARRLADYCGHADAEPDNRLKELNMGEWEMQRYDEITDPYLQCWFDDYLHLPTPGGESFPMQIARVGQFLDEVRSQPYGQVVVFAHAGVLVAASIHAGLYPLEEAWHHITDYGGLLELNL